MIETTAPRAANGHVALVPARRTPSRVAPLSVLPVFANLRGRPALVVGGGEGAAWKAELLAAAGAEVSLLLGGDAEAHCEAAHEIAERMSVAGAGPVAPGTVRLVARRWTPADLAGAWGERPAMALIDTQCHAEAASFAAIAREAGVTVNAIDKPTHCDVQFGSIVNRSPVVVGISTDGAAPILGQSIRRRVEALLPPAMADWAGAMRAARGRVLAMLPEKPARRAFFERFTEAAFRLPFPAAGSPDPIGALAHDVRRGRTRGDANPSGHVTLVGAGPGDAELLTIKAVRALQSADVILFDALVSADVLELARREARRMLVGKRAGRESCRQEDINALMLKLSREGRRVVRLKSGDPMVFGRAGEEIEALRGAGVPHDVVPGVTTAQALAASLNVSLTHRRAARSLRFVTGHGANGELPADLDWRGLADASTTLVVYMGARTAPLIAERLIAEGLPPRTPAIAASAVARPEQRTWHGAVADLAAGVATLDHAQPIVIAIGDAMGEAAVAELPVDEVVGAVARGAVA